MQIHRKMPKGFFYEGNNLKSFRNADGASFCLDVVAVAVFFSFLLLLFLLLNNKVKFSVASFKVYAKAFCCCH